jgi:outer membrane protein OmpA-like peptidoglycan-associated protein
MRSKRLFLASTCAFTGLTACASVAPSTELVDARSAYDRASHNSTAQLDPADLHVAKQTLDGAEKSLADGDAQKSKDAAYVAQRQVEMAEATARTSQKMTEKARVLARMHAEDSSTARSATAALGQANQKLATQSQQLGNERDRRQAAEKRAAQATADLARIASVRQEARGMVITLSGSVLFASGKSELLPAAQAKLSSVADALASQDPDSKLVVEGHTDSQGSGPTNQGLSERRAESVRAYLVSHGIAADRVTSQGFGSTRPVANNGSAEGRADNRRVEIVVQPSKNLQSQDTSEKGMQNNPG